VTIVGHYDDYLQIAKRRLECKGLLDRIGLGLGSRQRMAKNRITLKTN